MSRSNRLKPGARLQDVEIVSLGDDGLGVAGGKAGDLRVKGVMPGEALKVRVVTRRGRSLLAVPVAWQRSNGRRQRPPCRSFLECGGCTLQQLDVAAQLELKQRVLAARLDDAGVSPGGYWPAVTGPQLLYRRKARLSGRYLATEDEFLLGFHESFSTKVARMDGCVVLAEPFSSGYPAVRDSLSALRIRHAIPQVELAVGDDASAIVVRHLEPLDESDLERLGALEQELGTRVLLQDGAADSLTTLDGGDHELLAYRLDTFGVSLEFHPLDFVQVNATVNASLVAAAIGAIDPRPGERVLDLFCGIGNFTLPLARRGALAHGVEASAAAIERATHNAARNGLAERTTFETRDLYAHPPEDAGGCTKVLLDPPRSGVGRSVALLRDPAIERVVYVSCEPRTFALDAVELARCGFTLTRCGVFDMFPHTAHVETLGVFDRR